MIRKLITPLLLLSLLSCTSAPLSPWEKYTESKTVRERNINLFGSSFHIRLWLAPGEKRNPENLFKSAVAELLRISRITDSDDPRSEISKINQSGFVRTLPVSADLAAIFTLGQQLQVRSGGIFDISFAPLQEANERYGPDAGLNAGDLELDHPVDSDARKRVGQANWYFDAAQKQVRLLQDGSKLVVKGLAKGYAVQKAAEKLLGLKIRGFAIVGGGLLAAAGSALQDPNLMCIEDPNDLGNCLYRVTPLHPERLFVMGMAATGDRPGHVYNPKNGKRTFLAEQATVFGPDGAWVQGASTAVSIMNDKQINQFFAKTVQPELRTILIKHDESTTLPVDVAAPYAKVKIR